MWGILQVLGAWCLLGTFAETGQRAMGGLYWCNTLCMCTTHTNIQVQCFERRQVYHLVGIVSSTSIRLEKNSWFLEERVNWCRDDIFCLCHKHNNKKFQCTEEDTLVRFISDTIGDGYFNDTDVEASEENMQQPLVEEVEEEQAVETEEDREESEHRKRSERRKNKKNRKQRKNRKRQGKNNTGEEEEEEEDMATSEAPPPVYEAQPEPEPESEPEPEPESEPEPEPQSEPEPTQYQQNPEPTQPATTTTTTTSTTTPSPPLPPHRGEVSGDELSEEEERGEPLPKQEAVAASPAVTALQPPTRRQPFPNMVEVYTPRAASSREVDIPPRVQPILEVPKEKKTVASKVSQDLNELGSTVLEIQSDVVLNQRILLVAVAIAGIAMLGVIVLAIHGCATRRNNPPLKHTSSKKKDAVKDDNHVTKLNMEEAW